MELNSIHVFRLINKKEQIFFQNQSIIFQISLNIIFFHFFNKTNYEYEIKKLKKLK